MAGSRETGIKSYQTLLDRYGPDYFKHIGKSGGKKSRGGFVTMTRGKDGLTGPERARIAGRKGGLATKKVRATEEQT